MKTSFSKRPSLIIAIGLAAAFQGCQSPSAQHSVDAPVSNKTDADSPRLDGYFFAREDSWAQFEEHHFALALHNLGESPIPRRHPETGEAIYRFTWLRTFHPAFVFRLELSADGSAILATKSSLEPYFRHSPILIDDQRILAAGDPALLSLLERLRGNAWTQPPVNAGDEEEIMDGAFWLLEGLDSGLASEDSAGDSEASYRLAYDQAQENSAIVPIGRAFMALAGLEFDEETVY